MEHKTVFKLISLKKMCRREALDWWILERSALSSTWEMWHSQEEKVSEESAQRAVKSVSSDI